MEFNDSKAVRGVRDTGPNGFETVTGKSLDGFGRSTSSPTFDGAG